MIDIFQFPKIENEQDHITMVMTRRPKWSEERIDGVLADFGIKVPSRQADLGPRLVVRDALNELEIFYTSDSIRWSELTDHRQEPSEPVDLPDDRLAQELADAYLIRHHLNNEYASPVSVTVSYHSRIGPHNKVLANYPIAKEFIDRPIMAVERFCHAIEIAIEDLLNQYLCW